jgi:hypothetical protein
MITLKTLPQATAKQVFDQVSEHLLSQGVKSIDKENDRCLYRFNDLSCAAGCLISDKEYDPSMEGNGWRGLMDKGFVPVEHCDLISSLQYIHDDSEIEEWPKKLAELKTELGLDKD